MKYCKMKGVVKKGKKEGKKYMEMKGYRLQFLKKLHIEPYPGTLNLFVEKNFVNDLKKCEGIAINGFVEKGKEYGIMDGDHIEFYFEPFIKKHNKMHLYAIPFTGRKTAKVTIFYDSPFKKGRRDLCYFKKREGENEYKKTVVGKDVASILFIRNAKNSYKKLMDFIKEKKYSIMSPVRKIKYSRINEWQVEIKTKPD